MLQYLEANWSWGREHGVKELARLALDDTEFNQPPEPEESRGPIPADAIEWMLGREELAGKWNRDLDQLAQKVLAEGLREGATLEESIKALRQVFPDFSKHRLETIARTESTAAYTQGRLAWFMRPDSRVVALQFSAILDNRTTLICRTRDGLILLLTDERLSANLPPLHFRCRSLVVPITKSMWRRLLKGDPRVLEDVLGWVPDGGPKTLEEAMAGWDKVEPPLPGFGGTDPAPVVAKPAPPSSELKAWVDARKAEGIDDHDDVRDIGRRVVSEVRRKLDPETRRAQRKAARDLGKSKKRADRAAYLVKEAEKAGNLDPAELRIMREIATAEKAEAVKLQSKLSQAQEKLKEERAKAVLATLKEVRPFAGPAQKWAANASSQVKAAVGNATRNFPADWAEASNEFGAMRGRVARRGGYTPSKGLFEVSMGTQAWQNRVALHEMGHRMEHVLPELGALAQAYFESRTAGETQQQLSKLTGQRYGVKEVTKRDRFTNPYIGRDYEGLGTEIMSMGLEGVFWSRYDVWEEDESLLEFVIGALAAL